MKIPILFSSIFLSTVEYNIQKNFLIDELLKLELVSLEMPDLVKQKTKNHKQISEIISNKNDLKIIKK